MCGRGTRRQALLLPLPLPSLALARAAARAARAAGVMPFEEAPRPLSPVHARLRLLFATTAATTDSHGTHAHLPAAPPLRPSLCVHQRRRGGGCHATARVAPRA